MPLLFFLSILLGILLSACQVLLKIGLDQMGTLSWRWAFWSQIASNWWLIASGICFIHSSILWTYLLKNYPFSMVYPMISLCYVFGMIAAIFIFNETVPIHRWIGLVLILAGCFLITK